MLRARNAFPVNCERPALLKPSQNLFTEMLSLETLSLRDAGGGPSSSFFASATAGSYNVAAGDASSSSLFSSAAAEPSSSSLFSSAAAGSGAATNPQDAYVEWIAEIIASHGGIMTSANLGSSLVADDPEKSRLCGNQNCTARSC